VSVISEAASFDLFKHFGFQSGRDVDKFEDFEGKARSINGLYYITEGTNAYISAEVINAVEVETHIVFVARVMDCDILNDTPSVTYAYYHSNIKPQPGEIRKQANEAVKKTDESKADNTEQIVADETAKDGEDGKSKKFMCQICGYVYEGDELPKDFVCPLCKHGADDFVELT